MSILSSWFGGAGRADACRGLGHSADPDEIEDLEAFLNKTIPPEGDGQTTAGL